MKALKLLFLSLGLAGIMAAQSSPSFGVFQGTATVATSGHPCTDSTNVGSVYTQIANPSITSICQQTGASSLGQGAFVWTPMQTTTTSGGGSVVVAAGKTLTANNSLTLAGTDATTATFPSVSITVPGTILTDCGSSASCASPTTRSATMKVVIGTVAFSSATTATITGISPAFTGTQSYTCYASDPSHAAYAQSTQNQSGTSFIITSGTSNSDTWNYQCVGY